MCGWRRPGTASTSGRCGGGWPALTRTGRRGAGPAGGAAHAATRVRRADDSGRAGVLDQRGSRAPGGRGVPDQPTSPAADNGAALAEPEAGADARTVLAALATATTPVTVDELATALSWTLDRTAAAIEHAHERPELAGPYALRRLPPGTFTLAPRLDQLTDQQRSGLTDLANQHDPLTVAQAQALLAAINLGHTPDYETWREDHLAAEQQLKDRGLIRTTNGPHRVEVHPDVLLSLRYRAVDG
jgi:hypothetical protein